MTAEELGPLPREEPAERVWTEEDQAAWYYFLMGGGILVGPNEIVRMNYEEWLSRTGIPWQFLDDPDVRRMYNERHLPPFIARHEFFFILRKVAPQE